MMFALIVVLWAVAALVCAWQIGAVLRSEV